MIAQVLHRLDRAGAEVLVDALARGLGGRYRFVFFCLDGVGPLGEALRGDGFEVVALNRRPGIDRALIRKLRRLLTEHKVKLIHAHQYTPFFYGAMARGVFRRNALPVLFTEHGRHYPDHRSAKRIVANKLLLKRQDRVTAVSAFIRKALADNEGIDRGRIEVVYNGITPCSFGGTPTAVASGLREELDLSSDDFIIVQVARFHPVKDHATAVRAIGEGLRALHDGLPVEACPFRWDVPERLANAAARGIRVPDALQDPPPNDRLVVCHGDACAPNTLLTDAGTWSGHVDLGSLGVADRWADIGVSALSLAWNYGPGWEGALLDAYGIDPDPVRMLYYRDLWNAT